MQKREQVLVEYRLGKVVLTCTCQCCHGGFLHMVRVPKFCSGACRTASHRAYHMKGGKKRAK